MSSNDGMKSYIFVHRPNARINKEIGLDIHPTLIIADESGVHEAHQVELDGPSTISFKAEGHRTEWGQPCDATVAIITESPVKRIL